MRALNSHIFNHQGRSLETASSTLFPTVHQWRKDSFRSPTSCLSLSARSFKFPLILSTPCLEMTNLAGWDLDRTCIQVKIKCLAVLVRQCSMSLVSKPPPLTGSSLCSRAILPLCAPTTGRYLGPERKPSLYLYSLQHPRPQLAHPLRQPSHRDEESLDGIEKRRGRFGRLSHQ